MKHITAALVVATVYLPMILGGRAATVTGYSFTQLPGDTCTLTSTRNSAIFTSDDDAWCTYPVTPGVTYTLTITSNGATVAVRQFVAVDHDEEY